jgi:capsular polysaccharide biosynthesis protein
MKLANLMPGIQQGELLPEHCERRSPPVNLLPEHHELFAHEYERRFETCYVTVLDRITVLHLTWLQLSYRRLVNRYRPGYGTRRHILGQLRDLAGFAQPGRVLDEVIWASDDWTGNYFHWFTDVLPKLQAWREAQLPNLPLLLPSHLQHRGFVVESLQRLGFEIEWWQPSQRLEIGRLWSIGLTAPTGNFRGALLRRLRAFLLQPQYSCSSNSDPAPERFYLGRGDAKRRFLCNEAELLPVLRDHQITPVLMEGRSLAEQIDLFCRCKLLIGLHGAGLTNMLWMPPGSQVIEIRRRGDAHNNCYYAMAEALGHTYRYLQADDIKKGQDTHTAMLSLCPQRFRDGLEAALRTSET